MGKNLQWKGIGVSEGYAVGTAFVLTERKQEKYSETAEDPDAECKRLTDAIEISRQQIQQLSAASREKLGDENTAILESHLSFLKDPAFTGAAFAKIREKRWTAEKAVSVVTQDLYREFAAFDDDYIRERADDIQDIGTRLLRNLRGENRMADFGSPPPGSILFSHALKPSDTAQLDPQTISAFVTETGGKTSHVAILANGLGITAVVGCRDVLGSVHTGDIVIVDGFSGNVILNPDEASVRTYSALLETLMQRRADAAQASGKVIRAKSGDRILVAANIGSIKDLEAALRNGADGVGLFRTEFLYMDRTSLPTEDEQFEIYKKAAERLGDKPLTIRTLDIGGDKNLPYLKMRREANPFMGLRAIRLCLKYTEIFRTQLRAILRASSYGNLQVMFPMISAAWELKRAKAMLEDCRLELKSRGIPFGSLRAGMMVEIPSAALLADEFATQVDFFSIGTNDLTQYTLAADRMNEDVSELYDPMHPAVLKLIRMTVEAARRASIPCCMCGELASDERALPILLQYGLNEFSVSPGKVPQIKGALWKKLHAQ